MSLGSISPEFRDSLRKMADDLAAKKEVKAEPKVEVRIAMTDEKIEVISDEGTPLGADNK